MLAWITQLLRPVVGDSTHCKIDSSVETALHVENGTLVNAMVGSAVFSSIVINHMMTILWSTIADLLFEEMNEELIGKP